MPDQSNRVGHVQSVSVLSVIVKHSMMERQSRQPHMRQRSDIETRGQSFLEAVGWAAFATVAATSAAIGSHAAKGARVSHENSVRSASRLQQLLETWVCVEGSLMPLKALGAMNGEVETTRD